MPDSTDTAPDSWVLDLCDVDLRQLGALDDTALAEARAALVGKVDRPTASVAGSEGS